MDKLNPFPMWGLGVRWVKLSAFSWEKKWFGTCMPYYTIRYEFDYDDGHQGFGGGGTGTLFVNGKKVAEEQIDRTMGIRISLDETFDVGADAGEPVSEDYKVPFEFEGTLNKVEVHLGNDALSN